jgi:hypothetical protein
VTSLTLHLVDIPVTDRALAFIYWHYAPDICGQLDFLHALQAENAPALTASIHAVGLAALANIHRSSQVMLEAREEYGCALVATNAALQDPSRRSADSTLAAVVLLGMYEV